MGGDFTSYRGIAVNSLMKIDVFTGVLDTTFTHTSGAFPFVGALAVANGSVYLAGQITTYRGTSLQNLGNVDAATGVLDLTFTQPQGACHGTNGCGGAVWSLTPIGTKLYVGGDLTSYRGTPAYFSSRSMERPEPCWIPSECSAVPAHRCVPAVRKSLA